MMKNDVLASRLRHRVTLQKPEMQAEGAAQFSAGWVDVATIWAEVMPTTSRSFTEELLLHEQLTARVSHEVFLRFRPDVEADMRVVFKGRYFNIRSVVNIGERNSVLRLLVEEHMGNE